MTILACVCWVAVWGGLWNGPAQAAASNPKATTRPVQVTVYPNGARVVREGEIELGAGTHAVLFTDLPASIVEPSLRLNVEGPKGTHFYGVAVRKDFTPHTVDARTRRLQKQIQDLQDQRTDLQDKIAARQAEMNLLRTYGVGTRPKKGAKTETVSDFTQSAATIAKRIAELTVADRKDERKIRELDAQITALNRQLAQSGANAREKRTAQADLELKEAGRVRFKLTYQVGGASWTPAYDINLEANGDKPHLELGFNALIRQNTGEDWKGVTLTLSTSRPSENTQAPDPTNWWLGTYALQTQLYRNRHGMPSAAPEVARKAEDTATKFMRGKSAELEPAELELAKTVQSEFAVNYSIKIPKDILSDGSDHRVGVTQDPHPVTLTLVTVPRLSTSTFLEAAVTYGGEQILLPGRAELFRDGELVGNTQLKARAPGEVFDLGFGSDDLVRVERKRGDEKSSPGDRRYRWLTTVSNFHPDVRVIEVREQLPRTQQREIRVDVTEASPDPQPEDTTKPGLYRWRMEIKPKEKATVTFAYRVRYPENIQLTGME